MFVITPQQNGCLGANPYKNIVFLKVALMEHAFLHVFDMLEVQPRPSRWQVAGRRVVGPAWASMGQHGAAWANMGQHGAAWASMGQHGSVWANMGQHGQHGPAWPDMGQRVPMGQHGQHGPAWASMG